MVKDEILSVVDSKVRTEMGKVHVHCFKVHKSVNFCEYINFPNGDYLFNRYKDFIATLTDDAFIPQLKRRYIEFEDGIGEQDLITYIGRNLRISSVDTDTLSVTYDDTETFDEIAMRIYMDVLEYAKDCYRKEYLAEHTEEVKLHHIKDFYGKWIEDYKPNQFKGIEQGDFIAVKVKYTDGSGFDIKVGWYDKSINDNGYNIFVSNVDGEYEITSWCPMPKVK